jgi:Zn-dependent M28 family amino/carboxypeptidase
MTKRFGIATLALLLATPLQSQTPAERTETDIRYLAADAREGRGLGTAGLDSSAAYIRDQFRAIGLQPGADDYFQVFDLDPSAPGLAHTGIGAATVKNVIGVLPGRGAYASEAVVIGAHYDHLGYGGAGSLDPDSTGVIHNGADDNASGTAALLEAARILSQRRDENFRTIIFIAFTAEEEGLIGSSYYVEHPIRPLGATYGMINMDMVGRLRHDNLIAIGTGSATEIPGILERINADYGFNLSEVEDPWGRSDHSSFYGAAVPVVHLFTDNHPQYHRTTDDWQTINFEGVATIAAFAADLAWDWANEEWSLSMQEVAPPPPAGGRGYGAYLGSIPDMSGSPGGVRLTGVRGGSPADQAGIVAGDIIVQIGDFEVADLYGMTDALRNYHPGDTVTIAVMRDGERLEKTVTFGERGN